ncbi:hypothetical protein AAX29_02035 [Aliarcobacter thereius]|uniref:Uncharacterized protein n=1 Tax=Aliarcobacter thereius TaxID=544718 RepID=A0A1C0B2I5_9BACT|nr:hypothetical protein AAX29_02035 [Aliarcobacter thereius]
MSSDIKFDNLHYEIRHELSQAIKNVKIADVLDANIKDFFNNI